MNTTDEILETDPPEIDELTGFEYICFLETRFNLDLRGRRSRRPSRIMTPVSPSRVLTLGSRPTTTTIWGDEYYEHHH
jgi:hypothetical protein